MKPLPMAPAFALALLLPLAATPAAPGQLVPPAAAPAHDFARWEKEVAAYEAADRENPPPKGGILFVGSSTIRLWKTLAQDFPDHKVINRGFGGTEIVDATHFADRLIFPHEPKQIFLRAGGNDIHNGKLPLEVAEHFAGFVATVHARLPKAEIVFMGLAPSPSRWGENDKIRELNRLVRQQALRLPRVSYIETFDSTTDERGEAIEKLFVADRLHFSPEGYAILAKKVRPYLLK